MIKANSSIITTNSEAALSRELPYLKYRTEPLIIDVDLHKRQSVRCCWIWFTGRDSVCRGVSTFHWILKIFIHTGITDSVFGRSCEWYRALTATGARVCVGVRLYGARTAMEVIIYTHRLHSDQRKEASRLDLFTHRTQWLVLDCAPVMTLAHTNISRSLMTRYYHNILPIMQSRVRHDIYHETM